MSWEEAGGARNARTGNCRFGQVLGRDRGFLVVTKFLVLSRDRGSLCRDMFLRLQVVVWSRHSFFMSRQCLVSLPRRYRDRGFHVVTEIVTTRGQVLQHSISV